MHYDFPGKFLFKKQQQNHQKETYESRVIVTIIIVYVICPCQSRLIHELNGILLLTQFS